MTITITATVMMPPDMKFSSASMGARFILN